jgi:hypothetical protein
VGEKWVDTLKFNGDMRLRHEDFFNHNTPTAGTADRHRERMRLRFGVTATIQDFLVGFRMASGTGEQVSTNQTFGTSFSQKQLWIDQAYMQWKAHEYVRLTGGRMPNPFWRTYASDVMWDDDINPEGYAAQVDVPAGDRFGVFYNGAALPLQELGGNSQDPWMFGNQIGARVKASEDTKWNTALALYTPIQIDVASLAPGVQQEANSRVGAGPQLNTHFQILHFTNELLMHAGPFPVGLQADFIRNMDDIRNIGSNGYQAGAILGKAKDAKTWEAAYFYKYLEANASMSDFADSDFGNGGTNRKGHIMWIGYAPRDYVSLRLKYFITRRLDPFISTTGARIAAPVYSDVSRLQCDVVVKF